MARYSVLLLDNDGTLMDFQKAEEQALRLTCEAMGKPYDTKVLHQYSTINNGWWRRLEQGTCTKDELQRGRFRDFLLAQQWQGEAGEWNARAWNAQYMENLGKGSFLMPGAEDVCRELSQTYALYVVTNGVSKTQHRRIDHCPFAPYLSGIFVSEEAGAPKPEPAYFAHVFAHLPEKDRSRMLLIGDSPSSDLLGANRAGIDCCWFAPEEKQLPEGVTCTYRIRSLYELPALLTSC